MENNLLAEYTIVFGSDINKYRSFYYICSKKKILAIEKYLFFKLSNFVFILKHIELTPCILVQWIKLKAV